MHSILHFTIVALIIVYGVIAFNEHVHQEEGYTPGDIAALGEIMDSPGRTRETATMATQDQLQYLFADDGQPVRFPCRIC